MKLPIINFSLGGKLNTDFDAFMERMRSGVACFYYMKMPPKGGKTSGSIRRAYGTMCPELCPPPKACSARSAAWKKKAGLHSYWDFLRAMDGSGRNFFDNGWRAFYENRWLGWVPEIVIECNDEDMLEIPEDIFQQVQPLLD